MAINGLQKMCSGGGQFKKRQRQAVLRRIRSSLGMRRPRQTVAVADEPCRLDYAEIGAEWLRENAEWLRENGMEHLLPKGTRR